MAMAVRTVGARRVILASVASAARVVCGVDPTRKAQQSLSYSDNTSSTLPRRVSISSSGDGVLRCQAVTTLTAVREKTADGAVELEMRCLEESRTALRDSFDRAECASNEEPRFLSLATTVDVVAESHEQRRVYHGRRGGGDYYPGLSTPKEETPEDETSMGKSEMIASFEAALQEAGRNAGIIASLAVRAWRNLGDADRAEELYMKALELAPEDSTIQASYAQFLWQCDA